MSEPENAIVGTVWHWLDDYAASLQTMGNNKDLPKFMQEFAQERHKAVIKHLKANYPGRYVQVTPPMRRASEQRYD